jgi:hypothetical protein
MKICTRCNEPITEKSGYSRTPKGFHHYACPCDGVSPMPTVNEAVLKPCPFCGSSAVYVRFYNQPTVCCEKCLAGGPGTPRQLNAENKDELEKEAIGLWNNRMPADNSAFERVKKDLEAASKEIERMEIGCKKYHMVRHALEQLIGEKDKSGLEMMEHMMSEMEQNEDVQKSIQAIQTLLTTLEDGKQ